MVDDARINVLLGEADTVIGQLREMSNVYECVLLRYSPPSFGLLPVDENSSLRQGGSKPNMTPPKKYIIERMRYPKPSWIHGVG